MEIPDWFEKFRVDDRALAQSYEATPASWRSAIKSGIAINHFHFGETDPLTGNLRFSGRLGLMAHLSCKPAEWALLFIGDDVQAAARICALAILPRLAGVENVYAIIAGKPSPAALVTLELCGIEDIFTANIPDCGKLLHYASMLWGPFGRICFLHEGKLEKLARSPSISGPHVNLNHRPGLLLKAPKSFDKHCLEFCQGKDIETRPDSDRFWDAVFTNSSPECEKYASRLYLGPGCEGFWSFPELAPDFYHENSLFVAMTDTTQG